MTNKPHGNTGKRNALQGCGADSHLNIRINSKVKEKAKKDARESGLTMSKHVEKLLRDY